MRDFANPFNPALATLLIAAPILGLFSWLAHRSRPEPDRYAVDGESIEEVDGSWQVHAAFREVG